MLQGSSLSAVGLMRIKGLIHFTCSNLQPHMLRGRFTSLHTQLSLSTVTQKDKMFKAISAKSVLKYNFLIGVDAAWLDKNSLTFVYKSSTHTEQLMVGFLAQRLYMQASPRTKPLTVAVHECLPY